jgi:hypothetical protein
MSTVSVIIPAYNQADYLATAVQSVLDQTYPHVEVIVVDDGSTDHTAQVAQSFTDPRVRYVHQVNRGLSGARNTGIRHATGDFITYLDSDDEFLPRKVELCLDAFRVQPELGFVAGQSVPVNEQGQPIGKLFDQALPEPLPDLLLGNPLHVGSVMVRREWQTRVGFFDESLRSYEDWDMWLRLALAGCEMGWIDEPVAYYRFHQAQMTRDGRQMTTATFAVLSKFFAQPDLPPAWQGRCNLAYSRAHLRAAAQAYRLPEATAEAQQHMAEATTLDPSLLQNAGEPLAQHLRAWTDLPKIADPLAFLAHVYANLPPALAVMQARRKAELSQVAMGRAFQAYAAGDGAGARTAVLQAIRYQPRWLTNRGVLSILIYTGRGPRKFSSSANSAE